MDAPQPTKGRKQTPWRRNLVILQRLPEVERRHLAGMSNVAIGRELGLDEGTIRTDLKRLQELWRERIGDEQEILRGQAVRRLEEVYRRSIAAAEFDEEAERAVLYGEDADGNPVAVLRDDDGKAQFKGAKAQALNTARQAAMDIAKLLGIVVDKRDVTSGGERIKAYIGVDLEDV